MKFICNSQFGQTLILKFKGFVLSQNFIFDRFAHKIKKNALFLKFPVFKGFISALFCFFSKVFRPDSAFFSLIFSFYCVVFSLFQNKIYETFCFHCFCTYEIYFILCSEVLLF